MSQDNKKSMVMYQGDGSNNVFAVPMTKGKYGTISVAFVRRGLDNYEYNPTTWTLNDENTLLTWTGDVLNVGDYIVIERTTVRKQPYEFPNNQKHIERSDDNLERQIQEVADAADRALKLDPTYSIDSGKMNPVDWLQTILRSRDLSVRELRFIGGQLCYSTVDPESAEAEKTWTPVPNAFGFTSLRYVEQEVDGIKYRWIEAQKDGAWFPVAESTDAKAQQALDNSETAVSTANDAKAVADGIDAKAQQALDNSETAVSTANEAKAVADGIDAKAQEALDNSETAVSTANDAKAVADGIDAKAQEALDNSETNAQDITALKGAGGALNASNFNTATPTQKTLTKYAVDQIWPGNTNWAWNAANPAASTFTDANGVARTAAGIFNSTWVNNTYDDHRWQLTNTQNTTPKVFEWADVGRDIVSVATATTAGIVRVGSGSQMVVNPTTGDISLNGAKAASIRSTIGAPGLSTENEYTDNAIYLLQKGIVLQGAKGEKYTIRTDGSSPSGFIIYEGKSSANLIFSFQPAQSTITIGIDSYKIKVGSSAPLTSNDKTVATTEWVRDIITEQMGGDFVQYWDSGDAADHSHAAPGIATPAYGTWYRLYKSGWVEQGGRTGNLNNDSVLVTLPISMSNSNSFTALASGNTSGVAANYNGITCERRSSTQIAVCTNGQQSKGCSWQVVGYAGGVSLFAYKATDGTVYYVGELGISDIDELILYMQDNEPGFLMQKNSSGGFDYVDYLPPIGITTSVLTIMLSTGGKIDCSRSPADDTLYYGQ